METKPDQETVVTQFLNLRRWMLSAVSIDWRIERLRDERTIAVSSVVRDCGFEIERCWNWSVEQRVIGE